MTTIKGVNLTAKKQLRIALTDIYGVGISRARQICLSSNVDGAKQVKDLSDPQIENIRAAVAEFVVEGDLKQEVRSNIKEKMALGTYQGKRHRYHLPVHGQRTKTNAKTQKKRGKKR